MAKTTVDSFKGGRNVKYLREAWIWGFRCAQEGGTIDEPPSPDEIWKWWDSVAVPSICSPEMNADDDCVVLSNNMKKMTLEEEPKTPVGAVIPPSPGDDPRVCEPKKKPGRPKKVKKKKAKKAKNPKLSKPLLRELLQELELVGEDDKSDLKTLQDAYKEHYNSLLDEKGFVDEEKEGEFQLLLEKMSEAEEQWAAKQLEKKAKKEKKKAESDSSSNESEEEEPVMMVNPLAVDPIDAGIPAPHPESIEAKRREAENAKVDEEKPMMKVKKEKKEKKGKKEKKEKKEKKHKWKGGVKELREFLTEKGVEFGEKDRKPVLVEIYERYMDCEERKAEAEVENAPEMLKLVKEVGNPMNEVPLIEANLNDEEMREVFGEDSDNDDASVEENKVMAAKQIQHAWKSKCLKKDVSDDIPVKLPKSEECGYDPLDYEGVSYQVDRDTKDVLNMDGIKVGELENGIMIFEYPYDGMHAAKANAEVSEDSGEETEDMSSDEENDE